MQAVISSPELKMNSLLPSRRTNEGELRVFTGKYKRALCRRAAWLADERQMSARADSSTQSQGSCSAVSLFTETRWRRRQRCGVRVRTVVLCCRNWRVLTLRCRPHRRMSRASSDSSPLVVTGTMKSCWKAPTVQTHDQTWNYAMCWSKDFSLILISVSASVKVSVPQQIKWRFLEWCCGWWSLSRSTISQIRSLRPISLDSVLRRG